MKHQRDFFLQWLGQAGFLAHYRQQNIIIDPYLSDSLSVKYRDHEFPHTRMAPCPVAPHDLHAITWVLCSHGHTDHMDGETLRAITEVNSDCRIIVPRAEYQKAISLGIDSSYFVFANSNDVIALGDDITVHIIASAHETLMVNQNGEHLYLGFVLDVNGTRIYHSGDCVPYDGLVETLKSMHVDIALLPANGRSNYLRERGIAGNFTFEESVELCHSAEIPCLVPHHWGMFAFNTIDEGLLIRKAAECSKGLKIIIPRLKDIVPLGTQGTD